MLVNGMGMKKDVESLLREWLTQNLMETSFASLVRFNPFSGRSLRKTFTFSFLQQRKNRFNPFSGRSLHKTALHILGQTK